VWVQLPLRLSLGVAPLLGGSTFFLWKEVLVGQEAGVGRPKPRGCSGLHKDAVRDGQEVHVEQFVSRPGRRHKG